MTATQPAWSAEMTARAEHAAAGRLGPVGSTHWRTLHTRAAQLATATVAAVGLTALCCAVPATLTSATVTTAAAAAVAGVGIAAGLLLYALARPPPRVGVVLFDHGLVHLDQHGTADVVAFADITQIRRRSIEYRLLSGPRRRRTRDEITLSRGQAPPLLINDQYQQVAQLAEQVIAQVTRLRLPDATRQVADGQTVRFDPFAISRHGVHHRKETLPWHQIHHIHIRAGHLTVHADGGRPAWPAVRTADIANLHLLLTLADTIRAEARPT